MTSDNAKVELICNPVSPSNWWQEEYRLSDNQKAVYKGLKDKHKLVYYDDEPILDDLYDICVNGNWGELVPKKERLGGMVFHHINEARKQKESENEMGTWVYEDDDVLDVRILEVQNGYVVEDNNLDEAESGYIAKDSTEIKKAIDIIIKKMEADKVERERLKKERNNTEISNAKKYLDSLTKK